MFDKINFDEYTLKARIAPALLVVFPLCIIAYFIFPTSLSIWGKIWTLFVLSGGIILLSQIGRDFGKKKENDLFKKWGGKPTTKFLRYKDAPNKIHLQRMHDKLNQIVPELTMPTEEDENNYPTKTDEIYDSYIKHLISKTRNKKSFPLIFQENCNYGFRRNLWGMKPIGVSFAFIGTIYPIFLLFVLVKQFSPLPVSLFISIIINAILLLGWVLWVLPDWVKIAADAYAERLLESIETF